MLSVGFDYNRDVSNKIYFNTNGTWQKTQFKGALMLRPVFGKEPEISINPIEKDIYDFSIYPNPAKDEITIVLANEAYPIVEIYDISGRIVETDNYPSLRNAEPEGQSVNLDISNLQPGIYFVKINSKTNNYKVQKLIIQK